MMICTLGGGGGAASRVMLPRNPRGRPGVSYCKCHCYCGSTDGANRRRWSLEISSPNPFKSSPRSSSAELKLEILQRSSPDEVRKEIQCCYELIQKLGRGVIYLGSSRVNEDHPHYLQAVELARGIARLLECTTWTGAGPGLMDAAIKGALEAKMPVGGFKISKESVVRNEPSDMTAVVAFPGGIGTLDEVFEILALIQLDRIGSELPVPFLLMNYDSFYSKLLEFMHECEKWGTVARGEVASLWKVCNGNADALEYLSSFYNIPLS